MFKYTALAAAAAAAIAVAAPASAATVQCLNPNNGNPTPACNINLTPAGANAVAGNLGFDVTGTAGAFSVTYNFNNPFNPAGAAGSAVFNFDGDSITFTGGSISGGGTFTVTNTANGSSVLVNRNGLASGAQTITFNGTFNPAGNGLARVGGQLNLTAVPEPSTWAMFILGFGALGFAMRRRNAKVTSAKAALRFA